VATSAIHAKTVLTDVESVVVFTAYLTGQLLRSHFIKFCSALRSAHDYASSPEVRRYVHHYQPRTLAFSKSSSLMMFMILATGKEPDSPSGQMRL